MVVLPDCVNSNDGEGGEGCTYWGCCCLSSSCGAGQRGLLFVHLSHRLYAFPSCACSWTVIASEARSTVQRVPCTEP